MSFLTLRRVALRLPPCEPEPRIADARRRAPYPPSEIVTRRRAVLRPLHPTRPCRQHHRAGEMRVFVDEPAARLCNDPFGADEERHAQWSRTPRSIKCVASSSMSLIRQIRDDPRESFECRLPADIARLRCRKREDSRNGEDQMTRLRGPHGATQTTDGRGRRPAPTPGLESGPSAGTPARSRARRE